MLMRFDVMRKFPFLMGEKKSDKLKGRKIDN
jgi:hypothetical protein